MPRIQREDYRIAGSDGMELAVRHVWRHETAPTVPLLLLHGARAGGVASFDLPVDGGSLASDLAVNGHHVFVMDARGYGSSSRPVEMDQPAGDHPPLVRSVEVVRDICAVVNWICGRFSVDRVSLLGWATGGHWCGYYASLFPEPVESLIMYNALYGSSPEHPSLGRGSGLEDPDAPGHFDRKGTGAWRVSDAASMLRTWDNSIPDGELDAWRDPDVANAYVNSALRAGNGDGTFTHPSGALEDSYYLATGRQLWDASLIRARTLVIRSERDFWSRPEDVTVLADHLVDAAMVRTVTISDATHFVHLDRPERGRQQFIDEVLSFLAGHTSN